LNEQPLEQLQYSPNELQILKQELDSEKLKTLRSRHHCHIRIFEKTSVVAILGQPDDRGEVKEVLNEILSKKIIKKVEETFDFESTAIRWLTKTLLKAEVSSFFSSFRS